MDTIPLNISLTPPKASASKPASKEDAVQPDQQDFGNMLARQVEDAEKSSELPLPSLSEAASHVNEQDKVEIEPVVEEANTLPADWLAALLLQKTQASALPPSAASVPNFITQAILDTETDTAPASATDNQASAQLLISNGKIEAHHAAAVAVEGALPPTLKGKEQEHKAFVDLFKPASGLEATMTNRSQVQPGEMISNLSAEAQQPTAFPLASAATTNPSSPISINPPLAHPAWAEAFSQKVTWMATQRYQSAELHLNPPQLGPLEVVITISGDQATARFTSPHAAVRDAIELALPKLREMLADNGIMLGNAMVSDQSSKTSQENFTGKPQGGARPASLDETGELAPLNETRIARASQHKGMVDTFA